MSFSQQSMIEQDFSKWAKAYHSTIANGVNQTNGRARGTQAGLTKSGLLSSIQWIGVQAGWGGNTSLRFAHWNDPCKLLIWLTGTCQPASYFHTSPDPLHRCTILHPEPHSSSASPHASTTRKGRNVYRPQLAQTIAWYLYERPCLPLTCAREVAG